MAEQATIGVNGDTLAVSGVLGFDSVVALEAEGAQWLTATAPSACFLDLSGVTYSSSAGVALLLAWLRAALQAGKALRIRHLPADMVALVRVGGLEELLPRD